MFSLLWGEHTACANALRHTGGVGGAPRAAGPGLYSVSTRMGREVARPQRVCSPRTDLGRPCMSLRLPESPSH